MNIQWTIMCHWFLLWNVLIANEIGPFCKIRFQPLISIIHDSDTIVTQQSVLIVKAVALCQTVDWGPAFPISHLWTRRSRNNADPRSGFTGLLVCSPQFCTQINGSVYFLLSEVEQGCCRAEMKHRGLMHSFNSTLFISLHSPPLSPTHTPQTPLFLLRHCSFSSIPPLSLILPYPLSALTL